MLILFFISTVLGINFQKHRFRGTENDNIEGIITKYSSQPIDHFDLTNPKKINIRYFINDTQMTESGPLFVELGGEGTLRETSVGGRFVINSYAEKYKGLMLAIEHRFYGESIPEGGLTQENLGYLNAIQAIEDFVHIIQQVKKEYKITGEVIVFGGSYAGNLATWIRQKYPNVVFAAVASSAPIKATVLFTQFLDVIQNDMGETCAQAWKDSITAIQKVFYEDKDMQKLKDDFNTCTLIKDTQDFTIFMQQLQATMVYYPQYNGSYSMSIEGVCDVITQEGKTPYERMVELYSIMREEFKMQCSPSSYENTLIAMANTKSESEGNEYANTRSWSWQICTEYSYFQGVTEKQVFAEELSTSFYYILCADMFGIDTRDLNRYVRHINIMYGGMEPKATNVAFTSGSTDPWSPLCKHETGKYDNSCFASHIEGTAHCADLYAEKETDPENLKQQRRQTMEFIDYLLSTHKSEL